MSPKDLVRNFYESDLANDASLIPKFFHQDCELHWNSSKGFTILNYTDIIAFFKGVTESYNSLRFQISHLLQDGDFVTSRHTLYGKTIEDPDNEVAMSHFTAIWEVKDSKLYKCFEISQLTDEKALESNSFSENKI